MAWSTCNCCCRPVVLATPSVIKNRLVSTLKAIPIDGGNLVHSKRPKLCCTRASMVDSSDFVKRMERAWLISQQPRPVGCSSCDTKGHVECKWCGGTGFFILGDNMLCEVPSRNSSCVICAGKGSTCCPDCKGTGFRARWLEDPPVSK